ncbi:RNA polymerase sigma factor [Streptomyces shenzhenensis]|uniref:RNA polymerase sigma factor n=1 Tax=Streptomyces shenzhenensis TaxID=943815 RepID=UPI0015EFDC9A|nr:sigma-70 family RNA polymerase sigma factor [Streptomyces shenzhenensis]
MLTRTRNDTATRDVVALVRAAQAGDRTAFADLVAAHLPVLYGFVGRALNGHADVDDVVQETVIDVMRGLRGLREPDRFRSWTIAIAHREVQAHLRRRAPELAHRRPEAVAEPVDPGADLAERTVTELMLTEQRRELAKAARWLDEDDQRLLSLWWQEVSGRITRAELAAAMSVTAKHVSVRVGRMKTRLDAVRAVVRALHTCPRCLALDGLVQSWNHVPDPRWRKRLVRHVRDCASCGRHRRELLAPEELLLGAPAETGKSRVGTRARGR